MTGDDLGSVRVLINKTCEATFACEIAGKLASDDWSTATKNSSALTRLPACLAVSGSLATAS